VGIVRMARGSVRGPPLHLVRGDGPLWAVLSASCFKE
jgi:hypothetical protein